MLSVVRWTPPKTAGYKQPWEEMAKSCSLLLVTSCHILPHLVTISNRATVAVSSELPVEFWNVWSAWNFVDLRFWIAFDAAFLILLAFVWCDCDVRCIAMCSGDDIPARRCNRSRCRLRQQKSSGGSTFWRGIEFQQRDVCLQGRWDWSGFFLFCSDNAFLRTFLNKLHWFDHGIMTSRESRGCEVQYY